MKQAFLDKVRKVFDLIGKGLDKVKFKGVLGKAWEWFSWAVKGLLSSIWNLLLSPKVWPAVIVWGSLMAIFSFNVGQNHPERRQPVQQANNTDVSVCRVQQARMDSQLDMAKAEIIGLKDRLAKAETSLAEKPKTVVKYRSRPAAKESGSSFAINWPKF